MKNSPTTRPKKSVSTQALEHDLPGGERAYRYIRDALAKQQLMPGDRLREVELAEMIGLSRTPIREALARLESEGLSYTTRPLALWWPNSTTAW